MGPAVGWRSEAPVTSAGHRGKVVCNSAGAGAVMDSAPATATPTLAELPICSVINTQGMVLPEAPDGTLGAVYAIYDDKKKLQYIGTTTDLRNALRTALGRRPEKTYYYKFHNLQTGEPAVLQAVKDAWFAECGGQPNGNRLAIERSMWQQPVDAGAISERGRKGAAEEKARQLIQTLKDRGCKEEFTPNATLLLEGQVEFLPARNLSDEELAAEREAEAARMRGRRSCSAVVDGAERVFHTSYNLKYPTNGGIMMDVSVLFDGRETNHRIIVGAEYYEPYGLAPEAAVEAGLALLLRAKVARATEGMLLSSQFPVNYFALGQVEQWYGEEFRSEFERITGGIQLTTHESNAWRFNRIHDYGPLRNETADQLNTALGKAPSPAAGAIMQAMGEEEDEEPSGPGILDFVLGN
ncbi:hypothetical protein HYH03_009794 [Edaphochlamys debaryana]|uniref:Uncharacterized protein n=1 Tax=Edaphochlamys debaryana TaxID=47281 RepID=A0A835XX49_9CHLO|nr:hypothetical protein HYH03_009794 [Edaphochlamys debaryana]|eukprot:KAG2491838.1 hypothetical protein HYH03_009794 [Edaphochlamys debaryana]